MSGRGSQRRRKNVLPQIRSERMIQEQMAVVSTRIIAAVVVIVVDAAVVVAVVDAVVQ